MTRKPFEGFIKLENGLTIRWWRMAVSEDEAIRIATSQHRHVVRCWTTK